MDPIPAAFMQELRALEAAYLSHADPIRQSGFGAGEKRWERERGVIAEALDRDGAFLDVGCAVGYLLECLVRWGAGRGITIEPHGLDIGPRLIAEAATRVPAADLHVGDLWSWAPPRKYDYVYSLANLAPEHRISDLVDRLRSFVTPTGRIIIGSYGSVSRSRAAEPLGDLLASCGVSIAGEAAVGDLPTVRIVWFDEYDQPARPE